MARGDHKITSNSNKSNLGTASESGGSKWSLWIVGILVAFAMFRCVQNDEPPVIPVAAIASVATPVTAAASAPSPPEKLYARLAQFDSARPLPGVENVTVILGGGEYDITYETVDNLTAINDIGAAKVFSVNFNENSTKGDLTTADVIILIGSLNLKVADISETDELYVNILSKAKNVNAYFNFATSERGPPPVNAKRRVIVVGDIANVTLPASYGSSTTTLKVVDLNPSKDNQQEYELAMQKYRVDVDLYRKILEGNQIGTMPKHPAATEYHPPEYRPPAYHPPAYHPAPHPARP